MLWFRPLTILPVKNQLVAVCVDLDLNMMFHDFHLLHARPKPLCYTS